MYPTPNIRHLFPLYMNLHLLSRKAYLRVRADIFTVSNLYMFKRTYSLAPNYTYIHLPKILRVRVYVFGQTFSLAPKYTCTVMRVLTNFIHWSKILLVRVYVFGF